MLRKFDYFLLQEGYGKFQTPGKESTVYFQNQGSFTSVIHLMDLPKGFAIAPDVYLQIKSQLVQQFERRGFEEVHILTVVLVENEEVDVSFSKEDSFSWIVNKASRTMFIPDGHAEDFYGMKRKILSCLEDSDSEEYFYDNLEMQMQQEKVKTKQPFYKQPFVNYGIVTINIILFLLCLFAGDGLYQKGMMYPKAVLEQGKWYQLFTSMFLHGDQNHIFGNMILLFLLGNKVETYIGHIKYLILYLLSGIAGNLLSLFYSYTIQDFVPSLGASGAVYGVVGIFLFILILNKGKVEDITIGRYVFVFAYSLYLGFRSTNVDNMAHIGGLLAGFLLGIILYRKKKEGNK